MNFLYDLSATQPSPESKFHGGGAYGEVVFFKLIEIICEKKEKDANGVTLFACYNGKSYINPAILKACSDNSIQLFDLNKNSIKEIVKNYKINRAYSAMLNLNQGWPLGEIQLYTTVHGLRTVEMPYDPIMINYASSLKERIKFHLYMGFASSYYKKKLRIINGRLVTDSRINVITISRHSLASINSFYPSTCAKNIPVFASPNFDQLDNYSKYSEASPEADNTSSSVLQNLNLNENKYFLITSSARWAKNALRAVFAFDQLFSDGFGEDFKVVLTGVTNKKVFEKNLKNPSKFVFLNYVDRKDLTELTSKEYAFIYPSLNEGFGYPPVEAMKYGKPVAASGTSSIPEVCEDAAIYFDPYSVSEIKNRILQLLTPAIYKEFADKASRQYVKVSEKQKRDLNSLASYLLKN